MALLNSYNYTKPRNHVTINIKTAEAPKPRALTGFPVKKREESKTEQYLEQRVLSAKPEELTYMLYEGLVRFITIASLAMDEGDIEKINNNAVKAQNILVELRVTLNMDIPISKELDSLYEYMEFKLTEANVAKDKKLFEEVLQMAIEFKSTWKEAFNLA